mmetsp:Transcript_23651/g.79449  ORF Transcript_23651/g.79449 Transcript_23651/m.79449 type:complete len:339 (-) Transcript_23651:193-1209(-)
MHIGRRAPDVSLLPGVSAEALAAFDAREAECLYEEDKAWLLLCVEAAYASMDTFNSRMRQVFAAITAEERVEATPAPQGSWRTHVVRQAPPGLVSVQVSGTRDDAGSHGLRESAVSDPELPKASRLICSRAASHARKSLRTVARVLGNHHHGPFAVASLVWLAFAMAFTTVVAWPALRTCAQCNAQLSRLEKDDRGWVLYEGPGGRARYQLFGALAEGSPPLLAGDAAAACDEHGAFLTSIGDADEQAFNECLVGAFGGHVLIGLFQAPDGREPDEGWDWRDERLKGSAYRNWLPGAPNNRNWAWSEGPDCAVITIGFWHEHPCDDWEARYICKAYVD